MATKKCPYCAEEIQEDAVKCKHCGSWVTTPPGPNAAGEPALQATGPGGQPVRRLLRSGSDRMLAGVCGGLGRYLNMDPTLFRIIYAVATVFTGIIPGLILYIILAIVIPSDDNMPS